MCAAMAPSGGRSPYAPTNAAAAAAYVYDLEGGAGEVAPVNSGPASKMYADPRALAAAGYDMRSRGPAGPPMAMPSGYYPNEEEAHFGPPGTGTYGEYGAADGYFSPQRGAMQASWGYGGRGMAGPPGMGGPHPGGFIEDEYVTAFSDEEADDMDSRMSRVHLQGGNFESHNRTKSALRANEIERERSRRRQNIVKNKTSSKLFPGKLKLSMMNTGLIPLKKGRKMQK